MNAETTRTALALLDQGEGFAWVAILGTFGSSPRHPGAAMVVRADGVISGTVGGGPLEATIIQQAAEAVRKRRSCTRRFESAQLGMLCGGGGLALIEYVSPDDAATEELLRAMLALLEQGRRGWLVTMIEEREAGATSARRCLVAADGSVTGEPLGDLEALSGLAKRGGTYDRILADDPAHTFIQPVGAQGSVYVFGAGHCGEKLVPVLSALGFYCVIVDDRPEFANRERFPTADRIVVPESFDGVLSTLPIDEDSYVVIVTRGHSHDRSVLAQALGTRARYLGMIGSKNKVAETLRILGEQGFPAADLERVHAPIGLSIGAETPEEIAISIAAQLIQVRAGGLVTNGGGAVHGQ
jgi:xanthine dehydrogenase accessory factor